MNNFVTLLPSYTKINIFEDKRNSKQKKDTLDSPVKPSFTLGIIRMWVGAWGDMSLKAKTCQKKHERREVELQQGTIFWDEQQSL